MACDTADGTGQVVAVQRFDVLDLEGFNVEAVHAQQSNSVFCVEAGVVSLQKVDSFL